MHLDRVFTTKGQRLRWTFPQKQKMYEQQKHEKQTEKVNGLSLRGQNNIYDDNMVTYQSWKTNSFYFQK